MDQVERFVNYYYFFFRMQGDGTNILYLKTLYRYLPFFYSAEMDLAFGDMCG